MSASTKPTPARRVTGWATGVASVVLVTVAVSACGGNDDAYNERRAAALTPELTTTTTAPECGTKWNESENRYVSTCPTITIESGHTGQVNTCDIGEVLTDGDHDGYGSCRPDTTATTAPVVAASGSNVDMYHACIAANIPANYDSGDLDDATTKCGIVLDGCLAVTGTGTGIDCWSAGSAIGLVIPLTHDEQAKNDCLTAGRSNQEMVDCLDAAGVTIAAGAGS